MQDGDDKVVFTGDTLFHGGMDAHIDHTRRAANDIIEGCGKFFEGPPHEKDTALNKTLPSLPGDTKVYVGFSPISWT